MEKKPVEMIIWETRNKIAEIIRDNGLGASINRMIIQEIRDFLVIEERQIIQRMQDTNEGEAKEDDALKGSDKV